MVYSIRPRIEIITSLARTQTVRQLRYNVVLKSSNESRPVRSSCFSGAQRPRPPGQRSGSIVTRIISGRQALRWLWFSRSTVQVYTVVVVSSGAEDEAEAEAGAGAP